MQEWFEVRDRNGKLLFELSLVTGNVLIKKRELTTEVNLQRERERALRVLFQHREEAPSR